MISRGVWGWGVHGMVFVALIVNLWFGGDFVEALVGRPARGLFEIGLILAYMTLVVGMRAPLPWRRRSDDGDARDDGRRE
jgi:hypothetical protein